MHQLYIAKHLSPEYRALYDLSRTRDIDNDLKRYLVNKVGTIRQKLRGKSALQVDILQEKSSRYGNSGKWAAQKIRELSRMIFINKNPSRDFLGQWLSVELECIFTNSRKIDAFILFCRAKGFSSLVTIKDDGSLRTPDGDCQNGHDGDCEDSCSCENNYVGKEIVVTFKYGDWEKLELICKQLNSLGTFVNKSCGTHVHFDCRHLSAAQVTTLGSRIGQCVPALRKMLPKSRQDNEYCKNIINGHRKGGRYAFVNLQSYGKYKTLEVRGHSGTIDPEKIINWIKIIRIIMNTKNGKTIDAVQEMVQKFKFDDELTAYINKRVSKFNINTSISSDDVSDDHEAA